ncbi:putative RNA-directed DNA polymerase [Helianthus anomalus]
MRRRPTFLDTGLPKLSTDQAASLIQPFFVDEIWNAVRCCDGGKASGPDGFTISFFKMYWDSFKPLLVSLMEEFHRSGEISKGCNASFVALIPKKSDP